jgi:hypothetical protein
MGIALAKGILATLGIAWIPETVAESAPESIPESIPETIPEEKPEEKPEAETDHTNRLIDTIIKFLEWLMSLFKGAK